MSSGEKMWKVKAKDQYNIIWFDMAGQRQSAFWCSHHTYKSLETIQYKWWKYVFQTLIIYFEECLYRNTNAEKNQTNDISKQESINNNFIVFVNKNLFC